MKATTLGRTIRWARKRAGMTQHELARAVGVPQPSIARIERGTVMPRITTLVAILEATGEELFVEPRGPDVDRDAIRDRLRRTPIERVRAATPKRPRRLPKILLRLQWHGVPFVLVGDLAEIAQGAPGQVGPLVEVCHDPSDEATRRIGRALEDLGGLETEHGVLRLRTETDAGDGYAVLVRNAVRMLIDSGGPLVHVAAIEDLVRARLASGTAADVRAAAVLRALADEQPRPPKHHRLIGR